LLPSLQSPVLLFLFFFLFVLFFLFFLFFLPSLPSSSRLRAFVQLS
jgi:hypothetical protein